VHACPDLSEGGLAVAAAEMAFAGRLGLDLELASLPRADNVDTDAVALFSESSARFLVEVRPEDAAAFEETLVGRPMACLGRVTKKRILCVRGLRGDTVTECPITELLQAWQSAEIV